MGIRALLWKMNEHVGYGLSCFGMVIVDFQKVNPKHINSFLLSLKMCDGVARLFTLYIQM